MRPLPLVQCIAVACTVACTVASMPAGAQGAQLPPPLELRVPKPPTLVHSADGMSLVYELHVTNFGAQPATIRNVEVLAADASRRVLFSLADSALGASMSRPGTPVPAAERARLGAGLRGVVFLWVPTDARSAPTALRNRVSVELGSGDSVRTQQLEGAVVPVTRSAVRISQPLRGGPWLAANGPSAHSGHRRSLIPVGGAPSIAQRFAIDWVKLNDSNTTFVGDRLKNESYFAEGNDALAVADGRIVAVKDSIPENVPGVTSRAVPITLETVGGNHVIIDIGNGYHAFYAHLKPGSIRVHVGDRVRRGQVIGLAGNSGNSSEPHLHFHISDANSPLGSEGVPYELESFQLVGRCRSFGVGCGRTTAATRHAEIPLENMIVHFP